MTDIETMIKPLRLAWIPRLLKNGRLNWKFGSDHFLKSYGGLQFLLTCNYHVKDFENMPLFYKDILLYFHELKTLYECVVGDTILFNNKEICIDDKTFFWKEWFMKGIKRIEDLLDEKGQVLPLTVFQRKYSLKKLPSCIISKLFPLFQVTSWQKQNPRIQDLKVLVMRIWNPSV